MTDATGSSSYVYDPFSKLTSATNGGGQTTGYRYNADGIRNPRPRNWPDRGKMARLVDWLQHIDANLHLRTVPLEMELWGPVTPRITQARPHDLAGQAQAVRAWNAELEPAVAAMYRRLLL